MRLVNLFDAMLEAGYVATVGPYDQEMKNYVIDLDEYALLEVNKIFTGYIELLERSPNSTAYWHTFHVRGLTPSTHAFLRRRKL